MRLLAPVRSSKSSVTACSRRAPDLISDWNASTSTPRDRKELLRTSLDEIIIKVDHDALRPFDAALEGNAMTEINRALPNPGQRQSAPTRVHSPQRHLSAHIPLPDSRHRQLAGPRDCHGQRFDRNRVGTQRRAATYSRTAPGIRPKRYSCVLISLRTPTLCLAALGRYCCLKYNALCYF